jgi:hypothetical protein
MPMMTTDEAATEIRTFVAGLDAAPVTVVQALIDVLGAEVAKVTSQDVFVFTRDLDEIANKFRDAAWNHRSQASNREGSS